MNKDNIKTYDEKFIIKPTTVKELGRDLYSGNNSIISELIANSYDADATEIKIIFGEDNNYIEIEDNGRGMNYNEITNRFLKVGSEIEEKEYKSKYNRERLGSKGVGKLSIFALGDVIKIKTISQFEKEILYSFELDYQKLRNNNDAVEIEEKEIIKIDHLEKETIFEQGTIIKISNLLRGVKKKDFFKEVIEGISQVFGEILKENNNFVIKIKNLNKNDKAKGNSLSLKIVEPNFKKTLIFFSLDKNSDKKIEIIKEESKNHLETMKENGLDETKLTIFKNHKETWKLIKKNKKYEELLKGINKEEKFILKQSREKLLKGYIASIVASKKINKKTDEPVQSREKIEYHLDNKEMRIIESNMRIAIYSKKRAGHLHAKNDLDLAHKFYIKYLFGNVHSDMLVDKKYGEEIALPSREGFKTNDFRWEYLKICLKILGDEAMNFLNKIPKHEKEKEEEEKEDIKTYLENDYLKKYTLSQPKKSIKELIPSLIKELISDARFEKIIELKKYFILLSYKNKTDKGGFDSKKAADKVLKIIKKYVNKIQKEGKIKILYTGDNKHKEGRNEQLCLVIKRGFMKDPKKYANFHMFAFINEEYVNNFYTDIEYGMAFANSKTSKDSLAENISIFITDKSRHDKYTPYFNNDKIHYFNEKNEIKSNLIYCFQSFNNLFNENNIFDKKNKENIEEDINKIVDEYWSEKYLD